LRSAWTTCGPATRSSSGSSTGSAARTATLLDAVATLRERGIAFRSLHDPIDTSTAAGKLVFNLFAALAEFDRDLIRERTVAGMHAAIARGRHPGRKPALSDEQLRQARAMIASGEPKAAVARTLRIGRTTLYRHLATAETVDPRNRSDVSRAAA
jgi:DNA invertase Pin-like site-specific DNA recombinase